MGIYNLKKIKIAMILKNLELQGISKVVVSYCEFLDKSKYEVVVISGTPVNVELKKKCEGFGVPVRVLPQKKKKPIQFYCSLFKTLKNENVDIVHVHGSSATIVVEILVATVLGIKYRIAHSHSTSNKNPQVHKCLRPFLNILCTDAISCSRDAGKWMFGRRHFTVLYNGIDLNEFLFLSDKRHEMRMKLGISEDECVIGHVGRVNRGKNQEFLVYIFDEFIKKNYKARLLMVGTGPDLCRLKEIVDSDEHSDRIILYGETDSVGDLYCAMDAFVFPSLYEGLPVTLIEAQTCGLPCIVSDVITDEVLVSDSIKKLSLDASPGIWADYIQEMIFNSRISDRNMISDNLRQFSYKKVKAQLESLYLCIMGE